MCDAVGLAVRHGMPRRNVLKAALGGAAALGVTVGTGSSALAATAATTPAAAGLPPAEGARTQLVLLGTSGGPPEWPGSTRAGIASALLVGDRYYIVDAGAGVVRQAREARLGNWQHDTDGPLDALRAVFLTHLHSDHVVDLNNIMTVGLYNGVHRVDQEVPIWGPGDRGALPPLFGAPPAPEPVAPENPTPGTRDMVDLIVRAFATDFNDRAFDNRRPVPGQLFEGRDVPVPEQYLADPNGNPHPRMSPVPFYEDDRVRVSATLVQHAPVFPALAFRFDTEDGSVAFSGDTSPSENLVELAQGVDVLVHEVIAREWAERLFPPPRDDAQEGLYQHLINAHTVIEDVGPVAERAGAKTLVLSHLVPGNWPEDDWRRAQSGYSGTLVVGKDLDRIKVGTS
jgi:ribonuclease BN (tRNA processing enzyme)